MDKKTQHVGVHVILMNCCHLFVNLHQSFLFYLSTDKCRGHIWYDLHVILPLTSFFLHRREQRNSTAWAIMTLVVGGPVSWTEPLSNQYIRRKQKKTCSSPLDIISLRWLVRFRGHLVRSSSQTVDNRQWTGVRRSLHVLVERELVTATTATQHNVSASWGHY